jgi:hypothetical protein
VYWSVEWLVWFQLCVCVDRMSTNLLLCYLVTISLDVAEVDYIKYVAYLCINVTGSLYWVVSVHRLQPSGCCGILFELISLLLLCKFLPTIFFWLLFSILLLCWLSFSAGFFLLLSSWIKLYVLAANIKSWKWLCGLLTLWTSSTELGCVACSHCEHQVLN